VVVAVLGCHRRGPSRDDQSDRTPPRVTAANIVEQARRAAGRPSLSGTATTSPQIAFRVASTVRDRAAEIAAHEGRTLSQLAREALAERIAHTR